jgi:hypothetical protein
MQVTQPFYNTIRLTPNASKGETTQDLLNKFFTENKDRLNKREMEIISINIVPSNTSDHTAFITCRYTK